MEARVLVGVVGVVFSLPWFVAFWVFRSQYPQRQRAGVTVVGLAFGACIVLFGGSLFIPAWHRAAAIVLGVQGACVATLWFTSWLQRKRGRG